MEFEQIEEVQSAMRKPNRRNCRKKQKRTSEGLDPLSNSSRKATEQGKATEQEDLNSRQRKASDTQRSHELGQQNSYLCRETMQRCPANYLSGIWNYCQGMSTWNRGSTHNYRGFWQTCNDELIAFSKKEN